MNNKQSLKNIVYNSILDGIFSDEYKPGQIINEGELIKKFGYSKSPIREALIALCSDGIIHNIPRLGYEVVRLTRDHIEEILEYRLILEGDYLKKCYKKISPSQIMLLEEINKTCNTATDDIWTHWEANTNFHLKLLSFAGNKYAYQQLDKSMNILKRGYAQFYWATWDVTRTPDDVLHHAQIIENIRNKNIERALICLNEDLMDFGV